MDRIRNCLIVIIAALTLVWSGGCAPLPDVPKITSEAPQEAPPKILSSKGLLSPEQSKAVLKRVQRSPNPTDLLMRHESVLEMVSGTPLVQGNKATLLMDGRTTYNALFRAIEGARESIDFEIYKIDNDDMGKHFADLLLKKQLEGVQVNLMYDRIGSLSTPASFFDPMQAAGARVLEVGSPAHADHRKLLIVDGRLVITGGINISNVYSSTPFRSGNEEKPQVPWRDTDVEIEGPVAAEFQKLFVDHWMKEHGPPLAGEAYFPKLYPQGDALVQVVANSPGERNRITYISYLAAISYARHSIHLTNAYFIPDNRTLEALEDAASRGVDVKIIVPSISDSSLAINAMRYNYTRLLKKGVKLYERRKALLHAKTAVIDGVWSTVGSTNFDLLSFSKNYEVNAVVLGREFAVDMERMFQKDLAESEQIRLEKWEKRPPLQKMKEFFFHLGYHLF